MKTWMTLKILVLASVALLLPAGVHAEGTTCTSPTAVVPDGRIVQSFFNTAADYWLTIFTVPDRSYSFEVRSTTEPGFPHAGSPVIYALSDLNLGNCSGTSTVVVRSTTGIPPALFNGGIRLSFTATAGGFYYVKLSAGAGVGYTFSASETTMYSAAWSTNGTYNTFYSFFNTTNASVTGVLTLTMTDGTPAGNTPLAIPAGRTASTNTVALTTPRDAIGTAIFTHNAPPGAVLVEADIANFTLTPPYIQPVQFRAVRETP